jgi:membrane-bound lytic murein transglycosylase D
VRARKRARTTAVVARAHTPAARARLADAAVGRLRATVQVRAGDSLWGIAQKFGVALDELCRWNGIRNPRRFKLQIGHELVVYRREAASAERLRTARPG